MEFVYVVERSVFDKHLGYYPHGFLLNHGDDSLKIARCLPEGFFVQRAIAEHRPDWKQIIPYVLLRSGPFIWVMKRGDKGGEKRLHGMHYIGVGGHINPEDADDGLPSWDRAMIREYHEECEAFLPQGGRVMPRENVDTRIVGIINDDSNEVGAVHLGLVSQIILPPECKVKTEDEGRWVHLTDAKLIDTGEFESWTGLILEGIE